MILPQCKGSCVNFLLLKGCFKGPADETVKADWTRCFHWRVTERWEGSLQMWLVCSRSKRASAEQGTDARWCKKGQDYIWARLLAGLENGLNIFRGEVAHTSVTSAPPAYRIWVVNEFDDVTTQEAQLGGVVRVEVKESAGMMWTLREKRKKMGRDDERVIDKNNIIVSYSFLWAAELFSKAFLGRPSFKSMWWLVKAECTEAIKDITLRVDLSW